jgi:hypothetical protein
MFPSTSIARDVTRCSPDAGVPQSNVQKSRPRSLMSSSVRDCQRHFHEKLRDKHQIELSYTWVQQALQGAGLVAKRRKRGAAPAAMTEKTTAWNVAAHRRQQTPSVGLGRTDTEQMTRSPPRVGGRNFPPEAQGQNRTGAGQRGHPRRPEGQAEESQQNRASCAKTFRVGPDVFHRMSCRRPDFQAGSLPGRREGC